MKVCVVGRGKRISANFRPAWSTKEGKREGRGGDGREGEEKGEGEKVRDGESVCVGAWRYG